MKKDPLIESMDLIAVKLLEGLKGDTVDPSKSAVDVFNSVAKWISVKNRLDEQGEGDGIGKYQQVIKGRSHRAKRDSGVSKASDLPSPATPDTPAGITRIRAKLFPANAGGTQGDSVRENSAHDGTHRIVQLVPHRDAEPIEYDADDGDQLGTADISPPSDSPS